MSGRSWRDVAPCGTDAVFGDPLIDRPAGVRQVLGYRKPADGGNKGTFAGFLRDLELIFVVGPWSAGLNGRSSVLTTGARTVGNPGLSQEVIFTT